MLQDLDLGSGSSQRMSQRPVGSGRGSQHQSYPYREHPGTPHPAWYSFLQRRPDLGNNFNTLDVLSLDLMVALFPFLASDEKSKDALHSSYNTVSTLAAIIHCNRSTPEEPLVLQVNITRALLSDCNICLDLFSVLIPVCCFFV